jgi:DNA-binding transcriptional MerR regulator
MTDTKQTQAPEVEAPEVEAPEVEAPPARLLRIQEAAAEVGLTPRSVRYYEEMGLLRPAARSEGDYRLYDATDVERLRFIKDLRDDAGFSLAEIAQLLEDEEARERGHAAFHASTDPLERKRILCERVASFDRQIDTLQRKIDRLQAIVDETQGKKARTQVKIEAIGTDEPC